MSRLRSKLICLFNMKYCLTPTALSSPGARDDNGPPGKSVNHEEKDVKTALEGIKKMEKFNYTGSLGK